MAKASRVASGKQGLDLASASDVMEMTHFADPVKQLAKKNSQLKKAVKRNRTLARHAFRAKAEIRRRDESFFLAQNLLASLAHELNQPLTALAISARATSQLAGAGEVDLPEILQALEQLASQAERATELVLRMRQLATGCAPRRMLVDVAELVRFVLRAHEQNVTQGQVAARLHFAEPLPKISADRIQLEQVFGNLIRNAIEALKDVPADKRKLTITVMTENAEVIVRITDTGPGLAPAVAERIFEPYQTTKPQGMGLGLAVSHAIVQAHGGRLWVAPGGAPGTTFCLALPFAPMES
jgi:C4-dicarboxylate-specific signal transduction histidine kinase